MTVEDNSVAEFTCFRFYNQRMQTISVSDLSLHFQLFDLHFSARGQVDAFYKSAHIFQMQLDEGDVQRTYQCRFVVHKPDRDFWDCVLRFIKTNSIILFCENAPCLLAGNLGTIDHFKRGSLGAESTVRLIENSEELAKLLQM